MCIVAVYHKVWRVGRMEEWRAGKMAVIPILQLSNLPAFQNLSYER
jgi:hypothetical protein